MSSRFVYFIAAILTLTAGYACWCRAPLIWDGAYQFACTLETQTPYVYLTRFHTLIIWWPTVWASHFTSNERLLQSIYGLPFLLAPVTGLLASWWVVKDRAPSLIIWVVFGVAISTLPGQIFVINDSIFQQHLFWPLFMGLFVPLSWPKRIVLGVLTVFQFVHPIGLPLLFGGAIAAAGIAIIDKQRRKSLFIGSVIMLALCGLAAAKVEITHRIPHWRDTYAEQQATWENAMTQWRTGVVPVLVGLRWMWAAGVVAFIEPFVRRRFPRIAVAVRVIALACAGYGAAQWCYLVRGADTGEQVFWTGAIDYRRWIAPIAFPFFFFAATEAFFRARRRNKVATAESAPVSNEPADNAFIDPRESSRAPLGILLASIFALYLGMQSTVWHHDTDRLMTEVRDYPSVVVPLLDKELAWTWSTPLTHWATGNCIAVMQGKTPEKVFLDPPTERLFRGEPLPEERSANDPKTGKLPPRDPYYPFAPDAPPGPGGWFDFRPLLAKLAQEPPPTRPRREEHMP